MSDSHFILSGIIAGLYVGYYINPLNDLSNRKYNKLFDLKSYLISLGISFLLAITTSYRFLIVDPRESFYMMPMLFLILFKVVNFFSNITQIRNLKVSYGLDTDENISFVDRFLSFILLFGTFLSPFLFIKLLRVILL